MNIRKHFTRVSKPTIVSAISILMLVLGATAGSLTPSASPAGTMNTLADIYNTIAGVFDSSAITASSSGSLMGNLKYIENQLGWASGSNNIWNLNSGNVGIGTVNPNQMLTIGLGGNINLASDGAGLLIDNEMYLYAKGVSNSFLGFGAGQDITTGFGDVAIGEGAGGNLNTGSANVMMGYLAGNTATSSHHNTFIGYFSGFANTLGTGNLFTGSQSGINTTTGSSNTFLGGFNAGAGNSTGSGNTFVGWKAGAGNVSGDDNVAVGYQAGNGLGGNSSGNILIGKFVGNEGVLASKHFNTWIGMEAGRSSGGQHSVFLGYSAGYLRIVGTSNTGGYNTFLGTGVTGSVANITGAIGLGYGALLTASHSAVIGSGLASGSITDVYFGQGVATVSAAGVTLNATGGSGTDNAGAPLRIAGGRGTGTGTGGSILFQTAAADVSGSMLNPLTTRLTIDTTGLANFSGSASISSNLDITGTASASKLFVGLSGTQTTNAVCHPTAGISTSQELVDCDPTAGDYMELYPMDESIQEGEVVMPDPSRFVISTENDRIPVLIRASNRSQALGIVSVASKASDFNSVGHNIRPEDNPLPVALNGRVKVRISMENGPISVGDPLMLSSTPGTATKATTPGFILGTALDSASSDGSVMIFVSPTYWAPEVPIADALSEPDGLFASILVWFRDTLGITFGEGRVRADVLCAGESCVNSDQLRRLLDLVGGSTVAPSETVIPSVSPAEIITPTPSVTDGAEELPMPEILPPAEPVEVPEPAPEILPEIPPEPPISVDAPPAI